MDDQTRSTATVAAQRLLSRFKEAHPAWTGESTPVDAIAAWLELEIATFHPHDYPQGTYGYLEPDEDLIWLCRDLGSTLRRFTLAHELGHVVLHRSPAQQPPLLRALDMLAADADRAALFHSEAGRAGLPDDNHCEQPDVQEEISAFSERDQFEETLGSGQSYDPRSQRELAANIFAAELLMPRERLRALYLDEGVPPATLAALFDVSTAAMLNRLVGLLEEQPSLHPARTSAQEERSATTSRQFDEFQQAAIQANTPALIVAGPGSGKTSTLIGRVEYLVSSQQAPPERILALTFSRKAAQEMRDRLLAALSKNGAPAHSAPLVSTFHAFCADTLRAYGERVGLRADFALVDESEGYFILCREATHTHLQHYWNIANPAFYFPHILRAISRAKDELVTPDDYRRLAQLMLEQAGDEEGLAKAQKALEVAGLYELYESSLQRRGDTDFGGLIMLTTQLLQQQPDALAALRERYSHILVDEFQDINRASGVLLRLLAGEEQRVWVVGDANQAIYGFRGASPANIAQFQQDYPGAVVLPLSRNYRSRPDIVALAEHFRRQQLEPEPTTSHDSAGGSLAGAIEAARPPHDDVYVTLAVAPDNAAELHGLVEDARAKLASGYTYQDIVVLCRTRSWVKKVTAALVAANLPVVERASMIEREYIKDLLSLALLVADPSGMGILRAARLPEHPLSQADVEALMLAAREQHTPLGLLIYRGDTAPGMSSAGRHALLRLSAILQTLLRQAPNVWSLLAHYLFLETSIIRRLLVEHSPANQAMLTDYMTFLHVARRYDQKQQAERARRGESEQAPAIQEQVGDFLSYIRVLLTLGGLDSESGNRQNASNEEQDTATMRVMTVHASKGLEFPVVYLPQLRQQNFPTRKHADVVPAPSGMLAPECEGELAHESGESCLFYVAVTRARDELALSYSERNGKQKAKPSQYLDALLVGASPERLRQVCWLSPDASSAEPALETVADEDDIAAAPQPGPAFIAAVKPLTLHSSAIETYQRCPRQYMYGTIYGFKSEEHAYRMFHKATQQTLETLQEQFAGANGQQSGTQESAQEVYTQHWNDLEADGLPFASLYKQHGQEVADLLRRKLEERGQTEWTLHSDFTVDLAGKTIHVTVDRVEEPQGDAPTKFIRTRFGKGKSQTKPAAGVRELLYSHASRQRLPGRAIEVQAHNLSTGEIIPIKLTAKKEQSLLAEIVQAISGLDRDAYPPKPSDFSCPTCPFFLICPA